MSPACSRRAFLAGASASVFPLPARSEGTGATRILEARPGRAQLLPAPAPATDIIGFDGATPGPLLRYRQGDTLLARLVNKTEQPLTLHWQGMRGENSMDGVAPLTQTPVAPGASFDYRRTLADPGLFCYRPSVFPHSGELVGRGLKGLLVVEETTPLASDANLVVVLDDWKLDPKGAVEGDFARATEAQGANTTSALLTVNGAAAPSAHEFTPGARIRLRLANLANAQIMVLSFEGVTPYVIAIDSQPCDAFVPVRQSIPVAPGARFELMFDLPPEANAKARMILRGPGGQDQDLLRFSTKGQTVQPKPAIQSLPQNSALPREIKLAQSKKIEIAIAPNGAGWTFNGRPRKPIPARRCFASSAGRRSRWGSITARRFRLSCMCMDTQFAFCMTSMTAGSHIGATQSYRRRARRSTSLLSPTALANGRCMTTSCSTKPPVSPPGSR